MFLETPQLKLYLKNMTRASPYSSRYSHILPV
nr:MAG TPA: hypothetical protein [Bacteriophage sp.]